MILQQSFSWTKINVAQEIKTTEIIKYYTKVKAL